MTRNDPEQRPTRWDREVLGFRVRVLDLVHDGRTFLRRRGIEQTRLGGILLHRLDGPDPGLDLHDHPWPFLTWVIRGGYTEEWAPTGEAARIAGIGETNEARRLWRGDDPWLPSPRGYSRTWRRGSIHRMPLGVAHRIVAVEPGTITIVVRRPKVRTWGFYQSTGWTSWTAYDYDARRPVGVRSNKPDEVR